MPSCPEISQTGGQIWIIKIEHEIETHHPCHTSCHISVAAEVKVNLPGKGKSGKYGSMEDVDSDGDLDLVVQIENVINWAPDATEATLTGFTLDGIPIVGTDSVNIVPPGQ